jgi:hypothetical protein
MKDDLLLTPALREWSVTLVRRAASQAGVRRLERAQ